MIFTPRIDEAIKLAARLHRSHVRNDYEETPYVSHLFSVAWILSQVTNDEDSIIAGLMHDSLEDVPKYTYEKLVEDCGVRVAEIVQQVTEPLDPNKESGDQMPWLERKEAYLRALRNGGIESALVSVADKIHNTDSFLRGMEKEGGLLATRFSSSARNRLWFHEQVLIVAIEKLGIDNSLVKEFSLKTEMFKDLISKMEQDSHV